MCARERASESERPVTQIMIQKTITSRSSRGALRAQL